MGKTYTLLFFLVCTFIGVLVLAQEDCIYKECFCVEMSIVCQERELDKMPTIVNSSSSDYTSLNLNMNAITDIPAGSLLPNLTAIYLQENPTTTIEDGAFDDCIWTLQILSFSSPLFTRIPDAFRRLNALTSLSIQDANIQDWNEVAMRKIGQTLTTFDLDNVKMASWPTWIHDFSHLTELTINTGSISFIPDDAFDLVNNSLVSLSLTSNSLTVVPKAVSKLRALQHLFLDQNRIVDVTWLPHNSKLSTLSLGDNMVSDANLLSNLLRPYETTLSDFNLRANQLTTIPNITFLTFVGDLDLSYNIISDPFSGSLPVALNTIDLSHNLLPAIPLTMATLQKVTSLNLPLNSLRQIYGTNFPPLTRFVDFGNNLITELTDTSFPRNSSITNIHLNNNPLATISDLAFQYLTQLTELNLQSTRIARLPLALNSLKSISIFDMTGSIYLVCTCREHSLEQWILSMHSYNVMGDCGGTSIYEFFSELSSGCTSQQSISL